LKLGAIFQLVLRPCTLHPTYKLQLTGKKAPHFIPPILAMTGITAIDSGLDKDEDSPRRLIPFPNGQIVVLGGEDGTLVLLNDDAVRPVRRYDDDAVRALAVSADGRRVVVGFDSGSTKVYEYSDYDLSVDNSKDHPFLTLPKTSNDSNLQGDSLFSQLDQIDNVLPSSVRRPGEKTFAGISLDAPVRDLVFLEKYWLAVASEAGLCAVDVTSSATVTSQRHWEDATRQAHDSSGIRSLAVSRHSSAPLIVASLAMDGKLCLWELRDPNDPSQWTCIRREKTPVITKPDLGEILGADAHDRSCRGAFLNAASALLLPGATYLQMLHLPGGHDKITVVNDIHSSLADDEVKGHIETIVTVTPSPLTSEGYIVTTGRDGRVVVWQVTEAGEPVSSFTETTAILQWTALIFTSFVCSSRMFCGYISFIAFKACRMGSLPLTSFGTVLMEQTQKKVYL
jgi:WD40 repeat protein